jgi:carboxyl-terminal processing protease
MPCQQKAERILDEALQFMQKNYYRRDFIDWTELAVSARKQLALSGRCDDTYSVISWCFSRINAQHSFVMAPSQAAVYNNDKATLGHAPDLAQLVGEIKGEWLNDSIAYLTIPWVSTTDSLICLSIADSIQSLIARLDRRGISRWIVDLRQNSGGNCWPMLAGVGPLLGEGIHGYFVSEDERIPFAYRNGAAFQGRHILCRVSGEGYQTHCARKTVAVLTGNRTVSAGEIVALAFKGHEKTSLFGEPTAGLTTANATYSLSDHSMLILTVCREADQSGRICDGRILPDKTISSSTGSAGDDPVRDAAVAWLMAQ